MPKSINQYLRIASNLNHLHAPGFLIVKLRLDDNQKEYVETKVYSNKFTGVCVFILGKIRQAFGAKAKVYANAEGKKFIIFDANNYFESIAKKQGVSPLNGIAFHRYTGALSQRVSLVFHQIKSGSKEKLETSINALLLPRSDETQAAWCERILEDFNITSGADASGIIIQIKNFPPEQIHYYLALQHAIADRIPSEPLRPTIDLQIRGSNTNDSQPALGIMGGMGPLSDAEIISGVVAAAYKAGQVSTLKIDLFSAPPPRTMGQKLKRGMKFLSNVSKFATRENIQKIYMTSNTAHASEAAWQKRLHNKLVNLVDCVVAREVSVKTNKVKGELPRLYVVLGTKEAYDKNLYPEKLKKNHLSFFPVFTDESVELQTIIDTAKAGHPEVVKQRFVDLVIAKQKQSGATHALLGCTELPMISHLLSPEELEALNLQLIDTEAIFIEEIYKAAIST